MSAFFFTRFYWAVEWLARLCRGAAIKEAGGFFHTKVSILLTGPMLVVGASRRGLFKPLTSPCVNIIHCDPSLRSVCDAKRQKSMVAPQAARQLWIVLNGIPPGGIPMRSQIGKCCLKLEVISLFPSVWTYTGKSKQQNSLVLQRFIITSVVKGTTNVYS